MRTQFIEAIAKHLPPSASTLRLLDINGEAGSVLQTLRHDLEVSSVPGYAKAWSSDWSDTADAVVACDYVLNDDFLSVSLRVLRPGGRLIVVNANGVVSKTPGQRLEAAGYVRILVESAIQSPEPTGVLIRGEKPHTTSDTLRRIQQVAAQDAEWLDTHTFKGRYVHLLIKQTPNKPAWHMSGSEAVEWHAAAIVQDGMAALLAFSSLPKAVGFMQPGVLSGQIRDVNKVGKFSKQTAMSWTVPVLLNPDVSVFERGRVIFMPVDRNTAEAPDE